MAAPEQAPPAAAARNGRYVPTTPGGTSATGQNGGAAPTFNVVRRGYDPDQVAKHLAGVDAETTVLATDRAAALEQVRNLDRELASCRRELDTAHAEINRLRGELRLMAGPPDSVTGMNERLHVMLRLARDEYAGMKDGTAEAAAAHVHDVIAAVSAEPGEPVSGFAEAELRGPRTESEAERLRREAAEDRARLDEAAAAKRAAEDEEFRQALALRCREALAQITKMQADALRSARRVMDDADAQARSVLTDAREAVRQTVEDAQREVDDLHSLRMHLATQLDTSRQLLNRPVPGGRAAALNNGGSGPMRAIPQPSRPTENGSAANGHHPKPEPAKAEETADQEQSIPAPRQLSPEEARSLAAELAGRRQPQEPQESPEPHMENGNRALPQRMPPRDDDKQDQ